MALNHAIYGSVQREIEQGLHDAHEDPLGEPKTTFADCLNRAGAMVDDSSSKHGPPTSNSFRRTRVDGPDIGEVTSCKSAGEWNCIPRMGASGTTESLNTMTSVLSYRVITS